MGIQISQPAVVPELTYDRIFLEELRLTQKINTDHTAPPHFNLRIIYRLYAIDSNNIRHFQSKVDSVEIEDYAAVAYAKALQGDFDLANASDAIEAALAKILEDQKSNSLGTATVIN